MGGGRGPALSGSAAAAGQERGGGVLGKVKDGVIELRGGPRVHQLVGAGWVRQTALSIARLPLPPGDLGRLP